MSKTLIEKRDALVAQAEALAKKHGDIVVKVTELNAQIAAEAKLANLREGDFVDAVIGRGEKAKQIVNAKVLGVGGDESGAKYRVITGVGFEAETFILTAGQVIKVVTQEELEAAQAAQVETGFVDGGVAA